MTRWQRPPSGVHGSIRESSVRAARVPEEVASGIRTAKRDVELVAQRLRTATEDYEDHYGKPKGTKRADYPWHEECVCQPKVSALRRYKLAGFSVERLMNLLTALDQDVEIVIRRKPWSRKAARISVVAA